MNKWVNEYQDIQLMRISHFQAKPENSVALIYRFCALSVESRHPEVRLQASIIVSERRASKKGSGGGAKRETA